MRPRGICARYMAFKVSRLKNITECLACLHVGLSLLHIKNLCVAPASQGLLLCHEAVCTGLMLLILFNGVPYIFMYYGPKKEPRWLLSVIKGLKGRGGNE